MKYPQQPTNSSGYTILSALALISKVVEGKTLEKLAGITPLVSFVPKGWGSPIELVSKAVPRAVKNFTPSNWLGGYYREPDLTYSQLFPEVTPSSDKNAPGKDYMVYVMGSSPAGRSYKDHWRDARGAAIPFGYAPMIKDFAAKLSPKDRLHLVGYSAGGGALMDVAPDLGRNIESLTLLDPYSADPKSMIGYKINGYAQPKNVNRMHIFAPSQLTANDQQSNLVRPVSGVAAMSGVFPSGHVTHVGNSHRMVDPRLPVHTNMNFDQMFAAVTKPQITPPLRPMQNKQPK